MTGLLEFSEDVLSFFCKSAGQATLGEEEPCGCKKPQTVLVAGELLAYFSGDMLVLKNYYRPCTPQAIPQGNDTTLSVPVKAFCSMMTYAAFYQFCKSE